MIRYALKCGNDHSFESWFKTADAFESLIAAGMVTCPDCGSDSVQKTLMAPGVRSSRKKATPQDLMSKPSESAMTNAPDPKLVEAIKTLRDHVEKNSDYVGTKFAEEARAMHDGDTPHRPIYGEAKAEDAKKLIEDGVPAMPLPFIPRQKTN
ncbi:MAG: DUF1178 family protein [Silicimonas sp.]|nr:DUF1178 family protein [Silicimonas sp.]